MELKALKNLDNAGRCFTKGKTYEVLNKYSHGGIMDYRVINDQGEEHIIGCFHRHFKLKK